MNEYEIQLGLMVRRKTLVQPPAREKGTASWRLLGRAATECSMARVLVVVLGLDPSRAYVTRFQVTDSTFVTK